MRLQGTLQHAYDVLMFRCKVCNWWIPKLIIVLVPDTEMHGATIPLWKWFLSNSNTNIWTGKCLNSFVVDGLASWLLY